MNATAGAVVGAAPERGGGTSRWLGALLWLGAVVVMLAAAVYQRTTGPTYPLAGSVDLSGETLRYELVRSGSSTEDALVTLPRPGGDTEGWLLWRRYPTGEAFARVPFRATGDSITAALPRQPAAGKLEYFLELRVADGVSQRVPAAGGPQEGAENVIIRFKDPVPVAALLPHVVLMFFAILVGVRAGLGALAGTRDTRRYAWVALGLMSVGGMILGPVVQKHAFGAYWTGWPFGYDLTDNKTLIMWLAWVAACAALGLRAGEVERERRGRVAVALAALVMLAVYLIPHSLRGSQLDYDQLEQGVEPAEAIRTG